MDEFFEYAEHQLSQPPAPQDYIAGFTLYAVSRPCDQISIALSEEVDELHRLEDQLHKDQQRLATTRGRRASIQGTSASHQVSRCPRRWYDPRDWFKAPHYVVTLVARFQVRDTEIDTGETPPT